MLSQITPVILTYNEAANIGRTLACLGWATRVIVLDSGSSDDTETMARAFGNVEWQQRPFDTHAAQCNFVLEQSGLSSAWVLFLDADYQVPPESVAEMARLTPTPEVSGYQVQFVYYVDARPLSGALYPPRIVLFRPERGRYVQEGHTQRLRLQGEVAQLKARFLHDDRKQVARFFANQRRYAALEAKWLWSRSLAEMRWSERARRLLIVAPWLSPLLALLWRGGILDGWRGCRYAGERAVAETLVAWALLKRMLGRSETE